MAVKAKNKKIVKSEKTQKVTKAEKKSKDIIAYKTSPMDEMLDDLEKSNGLISSFNENSKRVSTTLASVDLILAGGLVSGMWYTFAGGEQSSKTTLATVTLASLAIGEYKDKIPIKLFYNYEGSFSSEYFINQARTLGFKGKSTDIFGIQDPKTGEYTQRPVIRKYDESIAEKFFNMLVSIERRLPDKIYSREKWWLVYDDTKENKKYREVCDEKQYKKTGKFWVETDNPYPQAIIIVDSYPAMLPEKQDEDAANDPIAMQARMFSTQLKRVKGRMQSKKIIVVGINQVRKIPMAMYGPTEDEACGTALKFYCMHEDTLLFTEKGIKKAKDFNLNPTKRVAGKDGLEECAGFEYKGHSQITTVTTEKGYTISGKAGHSVLTIKKGDLVPKFRKLSDLTSMSQNKFSLAIKTKINVWSKSNYLFKFRYVNQLPMDVRLKNFTYTLPKIMSPELSKVLGYLIGDGCVRSTGLIHFSCVEDYSINDYIENFSKAFSINKKVLESYVVFKNSKKIGLAISNLEIMQFLAYLGLNKSSYQKEIPSSILESKKECVIEFISGLFSSDCHNAKGKEITYSSASTNLIKQVHVVLLNFGIVSVLKLYEKRHSHGYDKGGMHIAKASSLHIYSDNIDKFLSIVTLTPRKMLTEARDLRSITLDRLPDVTYNRPVNAISKKSYDLVLKCLEPRSEHLKFSSFSSKWKLLVIPEINKLRTSQERDKILNDLNKLDDFVTYTKSNAIMWDRIKSITSTTDCVATYDGTMPATSTFITNGVISHNSDARLKMTSRSSVFGSKGKLEKEPSVQFEGKTDYYRYVNIKTIKNKTSVPDLETWVRIWIRDGKGVARGYDPVFDSWYFLTQIGACNGGNETSKKSKVTLKLELLKIKDWPTKPKAIDWLSFKYLISGTKEQQEKIFKEIGYTGKYFNLRSKISEAGNDPSYFDLFIEQESKKEKPQED